MINVEKSIRVLGYTLYTILWSPIIVLILVVMPIVALGIGLRYGLTVKESIKGYLDICKESVNHDVYFIKTGKW